MSYACLHVRAQAEWSTDVLAEGLAGDFCWLTVFLFSVPQVCVVRGTHVEHTYGGQGTI